MLGIAVPLRIEKGQLVTATDAELAYQHIISVLQTETFERLGLIDFGLPDYTFNSYPNFLRVGNDIRERLESSIDTCIFDVSAYLGDDGIGLVEINWTYLNEEQPAINLQFK
jgi:hypothetical protein